jgi:hypothetical protein
VDKCISHTTAVVMLVLTDERGGFNVSFNVNSGVRREPNAHGPIALKLQRLISGALGIVHGPSSLHEPASKNCHFVIMSTARMSVTSSYDLSSGHPESPRRDSLVRTVT